MLFSRCSLNGRGTLEGRRAAPQGRSARPALDRDCHEARAVGAGADQNFECARLGHGLEILVEERKVAGTKREAQALTRARGKPRLGEAFELERGPRNARDRIVQEQKHRLLARDRALVDDVGFDRHGFARCEFGR